jgi:hypothetical protein
VAAGIYYAGDPSVIPTGIGMAGACAAGTCSGGVAAGGCVNGADCVAVANNNSMGWGGM